MTYLAHSALRKRLVLVNILVGKSSSFSAPHHADVFWYGSLAVNGHSLNGTDNGTFYAETCQPEYTSTS